ncbi:MAG: hypothetical protein OXI63_14635, partial [Candidatus Poribacteria bacterium]|nr:hypothetical protein [Candidatus Poribacteria bacterium]
MHNFKKVTLGIFILPLLLIFQSVSYSQQITKPVTYHYKFAPQFGLLGEGIDWEKYIPGEDSPFAAHFKFLLSPPTFEGEMNAAVTLDLDQKDPTLSVQPRFVTDDGNTFVGKFESQGGVIITGDIVIDFSVLPFFNDTRKHRIPIFKNLENLSKIPGTGPIIEKFGKIAAKLDTLKDKGWDTTEHAHSLLLEEDESIRLEEVGIRNIFSLKATDSTQDSTEEEESALEFTLTDATIIAAHTTAATTTGGAGVVALDAVDDTLIKEIKEELGDAGLKVNLGILTPLTLSSSGVYLDGKFATRKGQPIVACGLDSDLGFYGLDRDSGLYTLSTNYVGNLKMEVDFVVSFDLFYNVSPLGITLWSGGIEVAEQRIGITDKEFTLNFEPTAPVKFEVDADSLMEAYREEATAAERFAQDFQHFTQWHLPEGTEMRLGSAVSAIAYSPDGCQIAVANWNGSTSIYRGNLHSIEKQKFYIGTNGGLDRLSFSPDGKTLAGGAGTTVWLWDVATRALKAIMSHDRPWAAFHRSYWITGLSFSPDGKTLASASSSSASWSEVGLWDVETGTLKGILGHGHGASFSPDGKILAT